jgi:hypothetical protein
MPGFGKYVQILTLTQRVGKARLDWLRLSVPEGDATLRKVVRGQFQGDFIARQDADPIAPQSAREVGQYDSIVFQFDAEETARKLF